MKKLLGIVVLGLLVCSNVNAGHSEWYHDDDATVNSLTQDGWKLFSSNTVATSHVQGEIRTTTYYTLTKGREVLTCIVDSGSDLFNSDRIVRCFKP